MTVCIAATCRDHDGSHSIVLCSDSRLDYGDLGSTNTAVKLDILGHGWCVQMAADDWGSVNHWKDNLKRRIQTQKTANVEQVARSVKESVDYFMKSVFCEPGKTYQLLLSGFSGTKAVIMASSLWPSENRHSLTVTMNESFACIGSGGAVASALLSARECYGQMPIEYVSYLVYEAKRTSEKTGGVGAITVLALHSPGAEETVDRAMVVVSTEACKAQLEVYYRGLWKVPVVTYPDFPPEFFTNRSTQPNPQSPTADSSHPPPSPESPAKSDES